MGIGDWGLGIGDWGLGSGPIPNPQSPIPNPQSPLKPIIKYFIYFYLFLNYLFNFYILVIKFLNFSFLHLLPKPKHACFCKRFNSSNSSINSNLSILLLSSIGKNLK